MKHETFIELLNLYVDGEIKPSQAAELEHEILHDPERRKIYRQYCQMHRACAMLAEQFKTDAATDEKVVAFPQRKSSTGWWRPALAVTSGAVAACGVFIAARVAITASGPAVQPGAPTAVATGQKPVRVETATTVNYSAFPTFANPWAQQAPKDTRVLRVDSSLVANSPLFNVIPALPADASDPNRLQVDAPALDANGNPVYRSLSGRVLQAEEIEQSAFQYQR